MWSFLWRLPPHQPEHLERPHCAFVLGWLCLQYCRLSVPICGVSEQMGGFFFFFHMLKFISFFNLWWILSYIGMKQPWVYMCSPSRSPLPPPSPPAPLRFSQCTRSERLSHASNLGWWSVSPQILYMFQCCSLETSHLLLLPQSLKDCSINLCLFFFCSAYRVIIKIFLNSIYMC